MRSGARPLRLISFVLCTWLILAVVHLVVQWLAGERWLLLGASFRSIGVFAIGIAWLQLVLAVVNVGLCYYLSSPLPVVDSDQATRPELSPEARRVLTAVSVVCLLAVVAAGVQLAGRWQQNAWPQMGRVNMHSSPNLIYLTAVDERFKATTAAVDSNQQRFNRWRRATVGWTEELIASDVPLEFKRGALVTLAHDVRPKSTSTSIDGYLTAEEEYRQAEDRRLEQRLAQQAATESRLNDRLEESFASLERTERARANGTDEQSNEPEAESLDPSASDQESAAVEAQPSESGEGPGARTVEQIRSEIGRLSAEISRLQTSQFELRGERQRLAIRSEFRQLQREAEGGLNQQAPELRLPICVPGGTTGSWLYLQWTFVQLAILVWLLGIASITRLRSAFPTTLRLHFAMPIASFAVVLQASKLVLF